MVKHINLVDKISRETQLPTDDVKEILKHAFREIRQAFGAEDPKHLLILGHTKPVKHFLSHPEARASFDRVFHHATTHVADTSNL